MTQRTNEVLAALASEWGVHDLVGLDDEQMEVVAVRLIAETGDTPTSKALRRIIADVKRAEGGQAKSENGGNTASISPEEPAPSAPRYLASERTTRARMQREADRQLSMAQRHDAESRRTGLYIVPRRPEKLPATKAHPACLAAAHDGGNPCERCSWLLGEDQPYVDAHLEDGR